MLDLYTELPDGTAIGAVLRAEVVAYDEEDREVTGCRGAIADDYELLEVFVSDSPDCESGCYRTQDGTLELPEAKEALELIQDNLPELLATAGLN